MTPLASIAGMFVGTAHAEANPWLLWHGACSDLQPGCGEGPANIFLQTLPNLAFFLLQIATGLSVLFIIWAGFNMVLNLGDEGKVGQQKTAIFYSLAGLFTAIGSQLIVGFVATQNWGQGVGGNLPVNLMAAAAGSMLTIFNGVFVLAIIYYGIRMLAASGDSGAFNSARTGLTWAIVGAVVVNIANALVQGVTTFFAL